MEEEDGIMIALRCPQCRIVIQFPESMAGWPGTCGLCGSPVMIPGLRPAPRRFGLLGCLAVGSCLIVAACAGLMVLGISRHPHARVPGSPATSSDSRQELAASVWLRGGTVVIRNREASDWTEVKVEANWKAFGSGYSAKIGRIDAGETAEVPLMDLADGDGHRFDPFALKVQNIMIGAQTPAGYRTWFASNP